MKRCLACGRFFEGDECPTDHSDIPLWRPPDLPPAQLCAICGHYFVEDECPRGHETDNRLITVGSAVHCDVAGIWSDTETLPGIVVATEGDDYRVLIALPGDQGSVSAVTLPAEKVSW